uniref:Uncharacterized protein n=1 Tax=Cannabis sativa TaxID=3483 RepID=A0A803Q6T0_CANSA
MEVVRKACLFVVNGAKSFQWVSRLTNTRKKLTIWIRNHFGFCKEIIIMLDKFFLEIQNQPPSPKNAQSEADIFLELKEDSSWQDAIWHQKSRETWLRDGDINTKFYHASGFFSQQTL